MGNHGGARENGLGLAGFIVSLVGLVSCGLLSPIGVILSIIGLFKEPRGFAIAGLIIGLIGTLFIGAIVAIFGFAMIFAFGQFGYNLGLMMEVIEIEDSISSYYQTQQVLPQGLDELSLSQDTLIDPWGTDYQYVVDADGTTYTIQSAGEDMQFDTEDDLKIRFNSVGEFVFDE